MAGRCAKLVRDQNPAPIRLSAERIQRRFRESHPDREYRPYQTDAIIEEVNVLMALLGEFSASRLPEMKPETVDLNPLLKAVNAFPATSACHFISIWMRACRRFLTNRSCVRR